jgi:fructuronate reductase
LKRSAALSGTLHAGVTGPGYDPRTVTTGIVHLGLGNFHRAHQAVYTDTVLADGSAWGICGVSMRTRGAVDALVAQDHLYTVIERGPDGTRAWVIGSLREALAGADGVARAIRRIAAADTRIVSLTVTEKGYCHLPATGRLDCAHPDIVHDLTHPGAPRSAPGMLLAGLAARMPSGLPITVLTCDNLPHNGTLVKKLVLELAELRDPRLALWIEANVAFPSTMVDRIVPATTPADLETVRQLGLDDAVPVATEPFSQWVIEDRFAYGRPAWENAGAQFVDDVAPFELMKLRMLNGAHSAMAYLGSLAGHEFIYQASSDAGLARVVESLWDELAPTLPPTPGIDIAAYRRDLMRRFRNTALPHRTWQIAMDGSQKLPQRLLAAARERRATDQSIDTIALAVAAWMRYVRGRDESGQVIDVRDPLAATFAGIAANTDNPREFAAGLLALPQIFGSDLGADRHFAGSVQKQLARLTQSGVRAVLD